MCTYKVIKEKDGKWHGYARTYWWQKFSPVLNTKTNSPVISDSADFWLYVLDSKGIRLVYETILL